MEKNQELVELIFERKTSEAKDLYNKNKKEINLNYIAKNGSTPLLTAIGKWDIEMISFLIENKVDNNFNETYILPLELAIECASDRLDISKGKDMNISIIRLLLKNGANPTLKNKEGETPLDFLERYFGYDNFEEFLDYYDSNSTSK